MTKPLVSSLVSQIRSRNQPVGSELFLHRQIPLLQVSGFRILWLEDVSAARRELEILRERCWRRERIATGITLPWVRKTAGWCVNGDCVPLRRIQRHMHRVPEIA